LSEAPLLRPVPGPAACPVSSTPALRRTLGAMALLALAGGLPASLQAQVPVQAPPSVPAPGSGVAGLTTPMVLPLTFSSDRAAALFYLERQGRRDAHILQGALGLLAASGGPIPASPSTAGQRLEGSPRWVLDAGFGVVRGRLPAGGGGETVSREERRALLLAPRLTLAAGLFEGFSPAPTVGGLGSLDVVGELRVLPVPQPDHLDGRAVAWGVGARVGVIRESFSLPGVTLVAMHRRVGGVTHRGTPVEIPLTSGDRVVAGYDVEVAPRVSSLRAVVGKDLWEVGVSGGVQRDRIRGNVRIPLTEQPGTPGETPVPGTGARAGMPVDRTTWFLGVNRTWVVTQVTAEVGWSPAPSGPSDPVGASQLPPLGGASSALSGAISFRITY